MRFLLIAILSFIPVVSSATTLNSYWDDGKWMQDVDNRLKVLPAASSEEILQAAGKVVGERFYLPVSLLIRGKVRINTQSTELRLQDMIDEGTAALDPANGKITAPLTQDQGRSVLSLESKIRVVKSLAGFIVVEGLEEVYRAISLGSSTVPVELFEDAGALTMVETWRSLKKRELVELPDSPEVLAEKFSKPSLRGIQRRTKAWSDVDVLSVIEENLKTNMPSERSEWFPAGDVGKTKGDQLYLPLEYLLRGQDSVVTDVIYRNAEAARDQGDYIADQNLRTGKLSYDDNRSSLSIDAGKIGIAVVKTPDGYVVLDGHHDLYGAIFAGSRTVPVKILDDYTRRERVWSMEEVWADLQKRGLTTLLESPAWLAKNRPNLHGMVNKPNRLLARYLTLKVDTDDQGNIIKAKSRGARSVLVIKVNNGVEFMEDYLADIFTEQGIAYDSDWGKDIPPKKTTLCRNALRRERIMARQRIARGRGTSRDRVVLRIPSILSDQEALDLLSPMGRERLRKKISRQPVRCSTLFGS